jgi:hypothetical protein
VEPDEALMARLVKASHLSKTLGISRHTVKTWCSASPGLAIKKGRDWYIKLEKLAERPGMDMVKLLTLLGSGEPWIRAVDVAAKAGIPRRTVAHWCATRREFGLRLGRIWYVNVSYLGGTTEQVEALRKWCPDRTSVIKFVEMTAGEGSKPSHDNGESS